MTFHFTGKLQLIRLTALHKSFLDLWRIFISSECLLFSSVRIFLNLIPLVNHESIDIYYLNFPNDILYFKLLGMVQYLETSSSTNWQYHKSEVYGVFALDTASTMMAVSDCYHWFAADFGSIAALDNPQLSPFDTPVMGAFISGAVQTFYCYRIIKIEKRVWPISLIVVMVISPFELLEEYILTTSKT